jgi:hypothetical protein
MKKRGPGGLPGGMSGDALRTGGHQNRKPMYILPRSVRLSFGNYFFASPPFRDEVYTKKMHIGNLIPFQESILTFFVSATLQIFFMFRSFLDQDHHHQSFKVSFSH